MGNVFVIDSQMGEKATSEGTQELLTLELQHELAVAKMEAAFAKEERDLLETHLEASEAGQLGNIMNQHWAVSHTKRLSDLST